jgi:hypothetical protein
MFRIGGYVVRWLAREEYGVVATRIELLQALALGRIYGTVLTLQGRSQFQIA